MMEKEIINVGLTREQWQTVITELLSLYGYQWNDPYYHANECGSEIVEELREKLREAGFQE